MKRTASVNEKKSHYNQLSLGTTTTTTAEKKPAETDRRSRSAGKNMRSARETRGATKLVLWPIKNSNQ